MRKQQSGFTLVEIAIVLVIIGLLLGGVLKGQELITNSKIKAVINDMRGISAAFYSYQDRYKALPGDDPQAATRFAGAVNGSGNGTIDGGYFSAAACAAANETGCFWQHTRLAGFMTGDTVTNAGANSPTTASGGIIGVQMTTVAYQLPGPKVCTGSLPTGMARSVDAQLDDGDSRTGSVHANVGGVGAVNAATAVAVAATNYPTNEVNHTLCMKI